MGVKVRRLGVVGGVELQDDVLPLRLDGEGRLHHVLPDHLRPRGLQLAPIVDGAARRRRQQAPAHSFGPLMISHALG